MSTERIRPDPLPLDMTVPLARFMAPPLTFLRIITKFMNCKL